jgi:hypothetical protein
MHGEPHAVSNSVIFNAVQMLHVGLVAGKLDVTNVLFDLFI